MSITEKPWYPLAYMFAVTAVFSGVLIGFSALTQDRVDRNEQIFLQRAILIATGAAAENTPGEEISRIFNERVEPAEKDGIVEYRLKTLDGRLQAIGVPFEGQGYWDQIRGVLGVNADRKTVTGIAFYQQNETPGLGGEIVTQQWRSQFPGKTIAVGDQPLRILQAGQTVGDNAVQAVTGATQTSVRLERMLNEDLRTWQTAFTGEGQ